MKEFTFKDTFWSAGDNVFIDEKDEHGTYEIHCLNHIMKDHIPENSEIKIIISIEREAQI